MSQYQSRTHFSQRNHAPCAEQRPRRDSQIRDYPIQRSPWRPDRFADGTVKKQAKIHTENNQRRVRHEELAAEEKQFTEFGQAVAKQEAQK